MLCSWMGAWEFCYARQSGFLWAVLFITAIHYQLQALKYEFQSPNCFLDALHRGMGIKTFFLFPFLSQEQQKETLNIHNIHSPSSQPHPLHLSKHLPTFYHYFQWTEFENQSHECTPLSATSQFSKHFYFKLPLSHAGRDPDEPYHLTVIPVIIIS